jgi:hypothetical protein
MSDANSVDTAAGAMRAMGDDPWRGPRHALVAWAFGPAGFLIARVAVSSGLDSQWRLLVAMLLLFLQWLSLLVTVVVVSHRCVRRCVEGWCLIGYWVATMGLFVTVYREDYLTLGVWLDAMLLASIALPLVAVVRWLAWRRFRARVSAA